MKNTYTLEEGHNIINREVIRFPQEMNEKRGGAGVVLWMGGKYNLGQQEHEKTLNIQQFSVLQNITIPIF